MKQRLHKQSGVSVLTLTLLLAVLGGALAAAFVGMGNMVGTNFPDIKNTAMIEVDHALMSYLTTHGYLPCPASTPEGSEEDCTLTKGWLPMQALHLTRDMFQSGVLPMRYAVDQDLRKEQQRRSMASWSDGNSTTASGKHKTEKKENKTSKDIPLIVNPNSGEMALIMAGQNREWWAGTSWEGRHVGIQGAAKWDALPSSLPDSDGDGWPDESSLNDLPVDAGKKTIEFYKKNFMQVQRTSVDVCEQISESVEQFSPTPKVRKPGTEAAASGDSDDDGRFTVSDTKRPHYVLNSGQDKEKNVNIAYAIIMSGMGDAEGAGESSETEAAELKPFDGRNKDNSAVVENPARVAEGYDDMVWVREHGELLEEIGCPTYFYDVAGNDQEFNLNEEGATNRWLKWMGTLVSYWDNDNMKWLSNNSLVTTSEWGDENNDATPIENIGGVDKIKRSFKAQGYDNLLGASLKSVAQAASVADSVQSKYDSIQVSAMTSIYYGTRQTANILVWDSLGWKTKLAALVDKAINDGRHAEAISLDPLLPFATKISVLPEVLHAGTKYMEGAGTLAKSFTLQYFAAGGLFASVVDYAITAGLVGADGDELANMIDEACRISEGKEPNAEEADVALNEALNEQRASYQNQKDQLQASLNAESTALDATNANIISCQTYYHNLPNAEYVRLLTPFLKSGKEYPLYQEYYQTQAAVTALQAEISDLTSKIAGNGQVEEQVNDALENYKSDHPNVAQSDLERIRQEMTEQFQQAWEQEKAEIQSQKAAREEELASLISSRDAAASVKANAENALATSVMACPEGDEGNDCRAAGCDAVRADLLAVEGGLSPHYQQYSAWRVDQEMYQQAVAGLETLDSVQTAAAKPIQCDPKFKSEAKMAIMDRVNARALLYEANQRGAMK